MEKSTVTGLLAAKLRTTLMDARSPSVSEYIAG